MYPRGPEWDPRKDPRFRVPQFLLVLMAVAIAAVVILLAGVFLYLADVWRARPLG